MRRADVALYRAKSTGASGLRFFDEAMDCHVRERDLIEREFRIALSRGEIEPFFQPLIDLRTGKIAGFEVLARWHHAALGQVAPERFIAIAEDTGLISKLTDSLLSRACGFARLWPGDITLSFNVSAVELRDPSLASRVFKALKDADIAPARLEIEITETALVRDLDVAKSMLAELRFAGVKIALDDFGTGYSSLYHLRNFKLDKIKIDRSFVHGMLDETQSAEIVAALVGLGRGLGLTITAEGIEEPDEGKRLLDLGCQQGQGHLFSDAVDGIGSLRLVEAARNTDATGNSSIRAAREEVNGLSA
ncbi:hypothetical protein BTHE68_40360 [Burkholderia sp. THE68]|nr:hypothetical protein BTHE68_40360 [Burkholderia sp. THE68]